MKLTEAATPPPFVIDVVPGNDAVTVLVTGEIDMLTATRLRTTLAEVVDTRPGSVVVDMAGVPFLDAAGMTALIRAYDHARRLGVDIGLVDARPLVVRALSVVNLVDHLNVTPHPDVTTGWR